MTTKNSMSWWRCYHGAPTDPKWLLVARRLSTAGPRPVRPGEVWAIASTLYDFASKATPRGSIIDVDLEEIACSLDFDEALVRQIFEGLRDKGVHDGNRILAWEKHQPERERVDKRTGENKRQQGHRRKARAPGDRGAHARAPEQGETQGPQSSATLHHTPPASTTLRLLPPREEESREDKIREDNTPHTELVAAPAREGLPDEWPQGLGGGGKEKFLRKVFEQMVAVHPVSGNASLADAWEVAKAMFAAGELPGPRLLLAADAEYAIWQAEDDEARKKQKQAPSRPVSLVNWIKGKRWEPLLERTRTRMIANEAREFRLSTLRRALGPVLDDLLRAYRGDKRLLDLLGDCDVVERHGGGLDINFTSEFRLRYAMKCGGRIVAEIPPQLIRWGVKKSG